MLILLTLLSAAVSLNGCEYPGSELSEAAGQDGEGIVRELEEIEELVIEETEVLAGTEEEEESDPEGDKHLKLKVTDPGYDICSLSFWQRHDYRYGPSIMLHEDGSMDVWLSSPGDSKNEYDYIMYKHSDDGGQTWTEDKAVLYPTPDSMDRLSVCDPDVFYYDGYYYMGYTSTISEEFTGFSNSIFLARAKEPDGPYEKWNGSGFGGVPEPILYYDGPGIGWGRGEPAFVVMDDKVFLYATMDGYTRDYGRIRATEVWTADLDEDWPEKLEFQGYAVDRTDSPEGAEYVYSDCDSLDVSYVEEYGKFVAVCTNRRFYTDSCLLYFESDDGISFDRVSELNENVVCGCHNSGIMGDEEGHIGPGDPVLVGYAYAGEGNREWGSWVTRFAPVSIELSDTVDRSEEDKQNLKQSISYSGSQGSETEVVGANPLSSVMVLGEGDFSTRFFRMDGNHRRTYLNASDISFSNYDEKILSVKDGVLTPVALGTTLATIGYDGVYRDICFTVLPEPVTQRGEITEIFSPVEEYYIYMSGAFSTAVRPLIRYENNELHEVPAERLEALGIEIVSEDESVCSVRVDSVLVPGREGDTRVYVYLNGERGYAVDVHVRQ